MPKVSVIIPVYNTEKYLKECLDSLVNQTLNDIEIICVDNNSTDSTRDILNEYASKDSRFVVLNEKIQGSAYARNKGLSVAKGEYIGFVDCDDYVTNNYYEVLYKLAIDKKADISATSSVELFGMNINKQKNMGLSSKCIKTNKDKAKIIIETGVNCNKIFKRCLLEKHSISFPEIDSTGEDNYFNALSIIYANKIVVTDKVTYYYRQFDLASTKKTKTKKHFKILEIYKQIDERINNSNSLSFFMKKYWLKVLTKRKLRDIGLHYNMMHKDLKIDFLNLICKTFPELNIPKPVDNLIVSLTSYPARINTVSITVDSLFNQSLHPEKLILVLAEEQFPNKEKDLPADILNQIERGLEIEWYKDIKSYKKLVPVLKKYPNSVIVTADDDLIYGKDWLKSLFKSYLNNPKQIHCHRAHRILFTQNKQLLPYKQWYFRIKDVKPSFNNFFTGAGGVLYPADSLYKDVLDEELFTLLSPHGDDIWFWAMAVLNDTKINVVKNCQSKLTCIGGTQECALFISNLHQGKNDEQLKNVLNYYPQILEKLDKRKFKKQSDLKFFQYIFSARNYRSMNNKWYKVIYILGIKLSFRNKNKEKREEIKKEKTEQYTNLLQYWG